MVAVADLEQFGIDDLDDGAAVLPVESWTDEGHPVVGSGSLVRGRDDHIAVRVEELVPRKYWRAPLDAERYHDLLRVAVEARHGSKGDVDLLQFDNSDDGYVILEYEIHVQPTGLAAALKAGQAVDAELREVCEAVSAGLDDAYHAAVRRLHGWGTEPLDSLVNEIRDGSAADKGRRLEELTGRLFRQVPGFTATGRVNTSTEEIDIRIQNGSDHPIWRRETAMLLAECKNWSTKCGRPEFTLFHSKLANRVGRVRCGFLISWNGFAETVDKEMLRGSRDDLLVVPIAGEDIRGAVRDGDFPQRLLALYDRAVLL